MTRATKPVWRKIATSRGDRCVAMGPQGIMVREPRARTTYIVSIEAVEDAGAKIIAMSRGHEVPQQRRRARRGGR